MKQKLDIGTWNRKEHFNFFRKFDEPFYGVTVKLDCTVGYYYCKKNGFSFYNYYLHKTLAAINAVENLRYRIEGDEVVVYDQINASTTVLRNDHTFGFSAITFNESFEVFNKAAQEEIDRVKNTTGLFTTDYHDNMIHFSALPWMDFTSVSQATNFRSKDSCPKVSVGKLITEGDKKLMAFSVHVHHALVDGYHLGLFFEELQTLLSAENI